MLAKHFYLMALVGVVTPERATFRDVSLSSFYEPLGKIATSDTLKPHLPENFTHCVIVTGSIPVLRENSVVDIDNVEELCFRRNGIEEVEPGAFKNLVTVKSLSVSHSNLKTIKEGVFDKLTIRELHVSYNPITMVSKGMFGELPQLTRFILSHNEIEGVDNHAFDHLDRIEVVDLSNNRLAKLQPGLFERLPNLHMLILQSNSFQEVNFGSPSVTHLDLTNNSISAIPKDFPKLTRLILNSNKITTIPGGIFNNTRLQQLELNNNQISSIEDNAFDNMPELTTVMLSTNKLTNYNPRWFHNTPNVDQLFLAANQLEEIPAGAFANIHNDKKQLLKLDNNKINKISPETFRGFKRISNLNLAHNNILVWKEEFLERVEEIDVLDLSYNGLKCPAGNFDGIFKANETYLAGNPLAEGCLEKIERWAVLNPEKRVCVHAKVC